MTWIAFACVAATSLYALWHISRTSAAMGRWLDREPPERPPYEEPEIDLSVAEAAGAGDPAAFEELLAQVRKRADARAAADAEWRDRLQVIERHDRARVRRCTERASVAIGLWQISIGACLAVSAAWSASPALLMMGLALILGPTFRRHLEKRLGASS